MQGKKQLSFNTSAMLKAVLAAKGITQTQLAELTRISRVSISRYISDGRTPGTEELYSISRALGVSMEYLLTGEHVIDKLQNSSPKKLDDEISSSKQQDMARRLRQALAMSGIKSSELASSMNVSPVTISRYLSGASKPKGDYISALADKLEVSERWIMLGDADKINDKSIQEWKFRALTAEAKINQLKTACTALGKNVAALGYTVESFSNLLGDDI